VLSQLPRQDQRVKIILSQPKNNQHKSRRGLYTIYNSHLFLRINVKLTRNKGVIHILIRSKDLAMHILDTGPVWF